MYIIALSQICAQIRHQLLPLAFTYVYSYILYIYNVIVISDIRVYVTNHFPPDQFRGIVLLS